MKKYITSEIRTNLSISRSENNREIGKQSVQKAPKSGNPAIQLVNKPHFTDSQPPLTYLSFLDQSCYLTFDPSR